MSDGRPLRDCRSANGEREGTDVKEDEEQKDLDVKVVVACRRGSPAGHGQQPAVGGPPSPPSRQLRLPVRNVVAARLSRRAVARALPSHDFKWHPSSGGRAPWGSVGLGKWPPGSAAWRGSCLGGSCHENGLFGLLLLHTRYSRDGVDRPRSTRSKSATQRAADPADHPGRLCAAWAIGPGVGASRCQVRIQLQPQRGESVLTRLGPLPVSPIHLGQHPPGKGRQVGIRSRGQRARGCLALPAMGAGPVGLQIAMAGLSPASRRVVPSTLEGGPAK